MLTSNFFALQPMNEMLANFLDFTVETSFERGTDYS